MSDERSGRTAWLQEESSEKGFSRLYSQITRPLCRVAESGPSEFLRRDGSVREKIVRCLWYDQFIDPGKLRTEDGRKLAVFFPGHWNESAGPDFRSAEFAFDDGNRVRADVEIHVSASDWRRHGHETDPAYAGVGLHVVLRNDLKTAEIEHEKGPIPQLVLQHQLSRDLSDILTTVDPDGYPRIGVGREGECCRSLRAFSRGARWLGRFLDIAGDERILVKAARFSALMDKATPDEVLYDALMEAMGYGSNRGGFRKLTRLASLPFLRRFVPLDAEFSERRAWVEAILEGASGFLEGLAPASADEATRRHADDLNRRWRTVSDRLPGEPLGHSAWNLGRIRPANQPARRIAGMSVFVGRNISNGLCRAFLNALESVPGGGDERRRCRRVIEAFEHVFDEPSGGYWAKRARFGPASFGRATRLIGRQRLTDMVVNVVIPLLLALSRERKTSGVEYQLHNIYCALKPRAENAVTRYMRFRIFGNPSAGKIVNTLRRQQALLQIFHDFCESSDATCETCGFLAAIEGRTP